MSNRAQHEIDHFNFAGPKYRLDTALAHCNGDVTKGYIFIRFVMTKFEICWIEGIAPEHEIDGTV